MVGFLQFIDNTLGTNFNAPVYDPKVGRNKLVKAIDTAAKQHTDGTTRAPNRAWKTGGNNAISFTPKIGGKPVEIAGQTTNYVPAEHFQEFLTGLKAAVEAGDLDKEIKAALSSDASTSARTPKAAATPSGRAYSAEGRVNIAMNNRYNKGLSDSDLQAKLIAGGHDADVVKAAIKNRKKA